MAKTKELTLEEKLKEALIPKEEQPYEIPENWEWIKVKTVLKVKNGIAIDSSEYGKGEIPLVRISNIQNNKIDLLETVTIKFQDKYEDYLIKNGDLLIAMSGATTGKLGIFNEDKICIQNQRIGNIKIKKGIIEDYRNYYFFKIKDDILKTAYGGAQPNISGNNIENFLFPLPPLEEQKRIVEKLDSMFEKINKAKELIQEVKENIESRKESILNKTFRGELTAEWRKNNQTEDAIELLKSINEEKVKNWEQECSEAEKDGKKKPSKPKIEDIQNIIISKEEEPYEVPKNWKWVKLENIAQYMQRGKSPNYVENSKILVISQKCVQWKGFQIDKARFTNDNLKNLYSKERFLQNNDILWNSTGTGTVGRLCILEKNNFDSKKQMVVDSHVTIVRIYTFLCSKFIFNYLRSPIIQNSMDKLTNGSTNQKELSLTSVKNIFVPLPPLEEQKEIVRILDEILEKESKIKELVELEEAIELLEKSILMTN